MSVVHRHSPGLLKRFVFHWGGDYLHPGKYVCVDVVLAGNVTDVRGEIKDESQVVQLAS